PASWRNVGRRLTGGVILCAMVALPTRTRADEPTKDLCIAENENAQHLRRAGKLRAARAGFLECEAKSCPRLVREDCSAQLQEVERLLPTVLVRIRDKAGQPLPKLTAAIDDEALSEPVADSEFVVDPGEHTFRFSANGYEPLTKTFSVRESARGQELLVTIE